mmetsp:Transcript_42416/g.70630  ORF Transcript_42416/g.70630 Transcript_42416/m.70630 type:complete len:610 (+) Transcript_42416:180-2009(+)
MTRNNDLSFAFGDIDEEVFQSLCSQGSSLEQHLETNAIFVPNSSDFSAVNPYAKVSVVSQGNFSLPVFTSTPGVDSPSVYPVINSPSSQLGPSAPGLETEPDAYFGGGASGYYTEEYPTEYGLQRIPANGPMSVYPSQVPIPVQPARHMPMQMPLTQPHPHPSTFIDAGVESSHIPPQPLRMAPAHTSWAPAGGPVPVPSMGSAQWPQGHPGPGPARSLPHSHAVPVRAPGHMPSAVYSQHPLAHSSPSPVPTHPPHMQTHSYLEQRNGPVPMQLPVPVPSYTMPVQLLQPASGALPIHIEGAGRHPPHIPVQYGGYVPVPVSMPPPLYPAHVSGPNLSLVSSAIPSPAHIPHSRPQYPLQFSSPPQQLSRPNVFSPQTRPSVSSAPSSPSPSRLCLPAPAPAPAPASGPSKPALSSLVLKAVPEAASPSPQASPRQTSARRGESPQAPRKPVTVDKSFPALHRDAWVTLLFQIIRIFVLSRVTLRSFRTLPGIAGLDEGNALAAALMQNQPKPPALRPQGDSASASASGGDNANAGGKRGSMTSMSLATLSRNNSSNSNSSSKTLERFPFNPNSPSSNSSSSNNKALILEQEHQLGLFSSPHPLLLPS